MPKTVREIRALRRGIEREIAKATAHLAQLQRHCPHRVPVKTHKSDTGNYDPTQDRYWIEYKCLDCGKEWTEDQRDQG